MTPSPCFNPRFVLLAATALVLAAATSPALDTVPTSRDTVPTSNSAPANAQTDGSGWRSPLDEQLTVTRPFDPPETAYGPGHRGVDLSAPPGSPVRAAGAGLVTYAGPVAGRGVVVVSHGSPRTTYEPVTAAVTVGTRVAAGDLLGHLEPGHPGCPTAGCLHWGLLHGETYLDPLSLLTPLTPPRPRLLPLG
jgi:murein DD-endopeptidase MepM/ murein hydrolase activator NlpD